MYGGCYFRGRKEDEDEKNKAPTNKNGEKKIKSKNINNHSNHEEGKQ